MRCFRAMWLWVLTGLLTLPAQTPDACRRGSEALDRRDLAAAEKLLRQCITAAPTSLAAYLQLCGVYQMQGNAEALFQTASRGIQRFPGEKRFYLTAGAHLGRQKQFARAADILEAAIARWPDDEKLRGLLAGAHVGFGMELLDAGKNGEAEKHLRRATALNPQDADAHVNLGRTLHNLNRYGDALAAFDAALRLDAAAPLIHFHRALALYALGQFDPAIEAATCEIDAKSDYPPSFLIRGQARLATGDLEKALADLETAARRMPDSAPAQFQFARVLVELGRPGDAEAALRKAMELDPGDAGAVNLLARVLLRAGRDQEAAPLLERAAGLSRKQRSAEPGEVRFHQSGGAKRK